jgi:hypothetical protein
MADEFSFSKNVPSVGNASSIPILQRQEGKVNQVTTPEFQSSTEALAASQNNLSAIGAKVAQTSSNEQAQILGNQMGKNPQGELTPSFTEFDANLEKSYHAQADATLRTQGQKLVDDSQILMAQSPRLTPELIAKSQNNVQLGLNKIAEQAPLAIKPDLQASFDSQALDLNRKFQDRYISEQREDHKNNAINAIGVATQNIMNMAMANDMKGAGLNLKAINQYANSMLANGSFTPEEARIYKQTGQQTLLNGQFSAMAVQAQKENKLPEFEKDYADKKLPGMEGMTNEQWVATGQSINQQTNFVEQMKSQEQNLTSQNMLNRIASNVGSITGAEWKAYQNSVTPIEAAKMEFHYIQARNKNNRSSTAVMDLMKYYGNPEAHANAPEKVRNATFNAAVNYSVEQAQRNGTQLSHEDAEVQVAASAGAPVPVFIKDLNNKLISGNPAMIESGAMQYHSLQSIGAGKALIGISKSAKAIMASYEGLRDSRDPATAAAEATDRVVNQDSVVQKAIQEKWSNQLQTATNSGTPLPDYALKKVGLSKTSFINPALANTYGSDILNTYSDYYSLTRGDDSAALKLTKDYVDENYGETRVNGGSFQTMHPLERIAGFKDFDGVPYIQQDVVNQFSKQMVPLKDAYDAKTSNEYWDVSPLSKEPHGVFKGTYDPIQLRRHTRVGNSEKVENFNVVLHGNAFDSWDVAVQSDSGMRNLFQTAPMLGIVNYRPNIKAIQDSYLKDHSFSAKNKLAINNNPKELIDVLRR